MECDSIDTMRSCVRENPMLKTKYINFFFFSTKDQTGNSSPFVWQWFATWSNYHSTSWSVRRDNVALASTWIKERLLEVSHRLQYYIKTCPMLFHLLTIVIREKTVIPFNFFYFLLFIFRKIPICDIHMYVNTDYSDCSSDFLPWLAEYVLPLWLLPIIMR